jgi:hypothetical protein
MPLMVKTRRVKRGKRGGMFSLKRSTTPGRTPGRSRSPGRSPRSPSRPPRMTFMERMEPHKVYDISNKSQDVACGVYHFDCNNQM